jgi:hypothetical protein
MMPRGEAAVFHLLRAYWGLAGGNVIALPLEAAVAGLSGLLLRKPLARLAKRARAKLLAEVHGRLDGIEDATRAAHRISADTHKRVTGKDHPAAPKDSM